MGNKIVMAVVAAMALGSSALADTPDTGMKNYDPASINSSQSSNRDTNLGTPGPSTDNGEPTQRQATKKPGTSYSGTSRDTTTGPINPNGANTHGRGHKRRTARTGAKTPQSNDDILGTGTPR
jgi:hypothetical protein